MAHAADRTLLAVAAPAEARAILLALNADPALASTQWQTTPLTPTLDLVITGVGKANAAGAVAHAFDPTRHRAILSIGICGSLPASPAPLLSVIAATHSAFADEGILTDTAFTDLPSVGFPPAPGLTTIPVDSALLSRLTTVADHSGPIATVSTCSGTDALAAAITARTCAIAEAMEGAAVGLVAYRLGVPFAELRVVSNTTGSRTRQVWDLPGALARLSDLASNLPRVL